MPLPEVWPNWIRHQNLTLAILRVRAPSPLLWVHRPMGRLCPCKAEIGVRLPVDPLFCGIISKTEVMMPRKDPVARRKYHREYMRRRYAEDPDFRERHRARTRKNDIRYRKAGDKVIAEFKANGCSICDESEPCCLSAHHVRGGKEFSIGDARRRGISAKRIKDELLKCTCLCENCHRKVHAGVLDIAR